MDTIEHKRPDVVAAPPVQVTEPVLSGHRESGRGSLIVQVVLLSLVIGALSGALVAGGIFLAATRNPDIARQLQPFSDLLNHFSTPASQKDTTQVTLEESSAVIDAVQQSRSAVVSIVGTVKTRSMFFNQLVENTYAGTGFVIDRAQGLILTNRHVVSESGATYKLITYKGEEISFTSADVVTDPANDVAIIKVTLPDGMDIGEVQLGDSSTLVPGQQVIAIGNALGKFDNTVTVGVVSALGRQISAGTSTSTSEALQDVIQTDAAINQGNSGGPLLNSLGQVIGINTAIAGQAESIGFAIPIDGVKTALTSYLTTGRIVRPWLGVQYVQLTADIAKANDLPVQDGMYVSKVIAQGPAETAGIKVGDIVLSLNGEKLTAVNSLTKVMQKFSVNDVIEVKLMRPDDTNSVSPAYTEMTFKVTLTERPASN